MIKGTPTLRIEYAPDKLPQVVDVKTGEPLGGVFNASVELSPFEVKATLQVTAEVFVETSNVDVKSEEFDALVRLAAFLERHLVVSTPELLQDLKLVDRFLRPAIAKE